MEDTNTSPHSLLLNKIALLKQKKQAEEELLKLSLKEFALSLKPLAIIKDSIHQLATDKGVKEDVTTAGIKLGTNFIIEKIMGRNLSIKGFIGSMLAEQLASGFIDKKLIPLIFDNKEEPRDQTQLPEYSNQL